VKTAGRERRIAHVVLCVASYAGKLLGCFINLKCLKERHLYPRKMSRWCRKSDVMYDCAVSYCICELHRNPFSNCQTGTDLSKPLSVAQFTSRKRQNYIEVKVKQSHYRP
jgi:hypothetical protein